MISFTTPKDAFPTIVKIMDRAEEQRLITKTGRLDFHMDLSATHANGTPLDFEKLLGFDDFDFVHDVAGIIACMDRETGKLRNHFLPRCALPVREPEGRS